MQYCGLTLGGAVFDLVVEKLGDEDQVCEDVEHHGDYLKEQNRKMTWCQV